MYQLTPPDAFCDVSPLHSEYVLGSGRGKCSTFLYWTLHSFIRVCFDLSFLFLSLSLTSVCSLYILLPSTFLFFLCIVYHASVCHVKVIQANKDPWHPVSVVIWIFCSPQIGVWNSQTGLNLTDSNKDSSTNVTDSMANRTLIVTTILVWIWSEIVFRQYLVYHVLIKLSLCCGFSPGKSLCHV